MHLSHVDLVRPGDVLAKSVLWGDGQVLLAEGAVLNERNIARLKGLGILYVYVEDELTSDIRPEDFLELDERIKLISLHRRFLRETQRLYNRSKDPDSLVIPQEWREELSSRVKDLIKALRRCSSRMIEVFDIRPREDYIHNHPANVAVVAGAVGLYLKLPEEQLEALVLGSLLHDVGKIPFLEEALQEDRPLLFSPSPSMARHPRLGYEILRRSDLPLLSAHVPYGHHERFDGKGYPRGIKGEEIHLLARIAALANQYDLMTGGTFAHPPVRAEDAVEALMAMGDSVFDPRVLEAFVHVVAVYPRGVWVELNDGQRAVVVSNNRSLPLRPVVRPILKKGGKLIAGTSVDLAQHKNLVVRRVLPGIKRA